VPIEEEETPPVGMLPGAIAPQPLIVAGGKQQAVTRLAGMPVGAEAMQCNPGSQMRLMVWIGAEERPERRVIVEVRADRACRQVPVAAAAVSPADLAVVPVGAAAVVAAAVVAAAAAEGRQP
jgi:hypothetical protein